MPLLPWWQTVSLVRLIKFRITCLRWDTGFWFCPFFVFKLVASSLDYHSAQLPSTTAGKWPSGWQRWSAWPLLLDTSCYATSGPRWDTCLRRQTSTMTPLRSASTDISIILQHFNCQDINTQAGSTHHPTPPTKRLLFYLLFYFSLTLH